MSAKLVKDVHHRRTKFRTNHVLVLIGDDFRFQVAKASFEPLDLIIEQVNAGTAAHGIRVQYSLPSAYFAAVGVDGFVAPAAPEGPAGPAGPAGLPPRPDFPCHEGHLLPYEDKPFDNNWSGFYSSRPVRLCTSRRITDNSAVQRNTRSDAILSVARASQIVLRWSSGWHLESTVAPLKGWRGGA